jgi:hypothetical protein
VDPASRHLAFRGKGQARGMAGRNRNPDCSTSRGQEWPRSAPHATELPMRSPANGTAGSSLVTSPTFGRRATGKSRAIPSCGTCSIPTLLTSSFGTPRQTPVGMEGPARVARSSQALGRSGGKGDLVSFGEGACLNDDGMNQFSGCRGGQPPAGLWTSRGSRSRGLRGCTSCRDTPNPQLPAISSSSRRAQIKKSPGRSRGF